MRRPAPTISRKATSTAVRAEQAELLADGGEDEVGLDRRDAVGVAEAEAGAGDAAARPGRTAPARLEAGVRRRRPTGRARCRPASCTWANVRQAKHGAGGEQARADAEVGGPLGGDPQHHHEQGEEQQRRARGPSRRSSPRSETPQASSTGPRCLGSGSVERADAPRWPCRAARASRRGRSEEDGQHDLGELAGLEVDRPEARPRCGRR